MFVVVSLIFVADTKIVFVYNFVAPLINFDSCFIETYLRKTIAKSKMKSFDALVCGIQP